MTDRELLELAAKAAGYDKTMDVVGVCDKSGKWCNYVKNRHYINGREQVTYWNPLTDDGDALRLAVKLRLDTLQKFGGAVFVTNHRLGARELIKEDPYAATRRAIVRAAADIGNGME